MSCWQMQHGELFRRPSAFTLSSASERRRPDHEGMFIPLMSMTYILTSPYALDDVTT